MKIKRFLVTLFLVTTFVIVTDNFAKAQVGNQSDVTGPNPIEMIPFNNQSDVTGPDSAQILPFRPLNGNLQVDPEEFQRSLKNAIQTNNPRLAIQLIEENNAIEFQEYLRVTLYGEVATPEEISNRLTQLWQQTGKKSAVVYVNQGQDELYLIGIFPDLNFIAHDQEQLLATTQGKKILAQNSLPIIAKTIPISSEEFRNDIQTIQQNLSDPFLEDREKYLPSAQKLYDSMIKPLKANFEANEIDTLVFILDQGLRSLPIAALYDREQQKYIIEEYGVAIVPSFGLTDTRYKNVDLTSILAMGASEFEQQSDLPSVPIELQEIVSLPRGGEVFLNEQFTIDNFLEQNKQKKFEIIHLGTHAEFNAGDINQSYIQFSDDQLSLQQIEQLSSQLSWDIPENVSVQLFALSACQTALGSKEAELGFVGLAVASGVKSALASLWYVSDLGTLALMSQFYQNYTTIPVKSEAFRQAQLSLLRGEVFIEDDQIVLADGSAITLPEEFQGRDFDFSKPFVWSAFTIIGNWN